MDWPSAEYWVQGTVWVSTAAFATGAVKCLFDLEMIPANKYFKASLSVVVVLVTFAAWWAAAVREEQMNLPIREIPDEVSLKAALEEILPSVPLVRYCTLDNLPETNQYSTQFLALFPKGMKAELVSGRDCSPLVVDAAYGLAIGVAELESPPQAAVEFQRAIAAGKMVQPPRFAQVGMSKSERSSAMISAKGHQPIGDEEFWFVIGGNSKEQHETR